MNYAISTFVTDYSMPPASLARAIEERGFDSVWVAEHTHMPVVHLPSPYDPVGQPLDRCYWHTHDPFITLMAMAMVTTTLKLATGICLLIQRDPITAAKEIASLDVLSGGRVIFGVGAGWSPEEMANHGTLFKGRYALLEERVKAMKAIWCEEEPEFHGKHVNFDPIRSYPKPAQDPHPPVVFGGDGPRTRQRVAEYCEGWYPFWDADDWPEFKARIEDVHAHARELGRDPGSIEISVGGSAPDPTLTPEMQALGVNRVILDLPPLSGDDMLRELDKLARHIQ